MQRTTRKHSSEFDELYHLISKSKTRYVSVRYLESLPEAQTLARKHGHESVRSLVMAAHKAGRICLKSRNEDKSRLYVYRPNEIAIEKVREQVLNIFDSVCASLLREGFLLAENVIRKRIASILYQSHGPVAGDIFLDPGLFDKDPWTEVLKTKLKDPMWTINDKFRTTKGFRVLKWKSHQTGDREATIEGRVVRLADVNEPKIENVPQDLWRSFVDWCEEQKRTRGKDIRAKGRYRMAEIIANSKPSFAKNVPLGHLVELVQLAVSTGHMRFRKPNGVVLPVDSKDIPLYEYMRTARTRSRFDFASSK